MRAKARDKQEAADGDDSKQHKVASAVKAHPEWTRGSRREGVGVSGLGRGTCLFKGVEI